MPNFADRTMLVALHVRGWTGRRKDKAVTDEVHQIHGAAADAGAYSKQLIPRPAFKEVTEAESALRGFHKAQTLPWTDDGMRVLPTTNHMAYTDGLRSLTYAHGEAVRAFVEAFPGLVDQAAVRLNGMFRLDDYPTQAELRGQYGLDVNFYPFPKAADFRVDLADHDLAVIRNQLQAAETEAHQVAMHDLWTRLHDTVKHMADKLAVPIGEPGSVFRDSLVSNLEDLVDLLPRLNVTEDPDLTRMAEDAKRDLVVPVGVLRDNASERATRARAAEDMVKRMAGYLPN